MKNLLRGLAFLTIFFVSSILDAKKLEISNKSQFPMLHTFYNYRNRPVTSFILNGNSDLIVVVPRDATTIQMKPSGAGWVGNDVVIPISSIKTNSRRNLEITVSSILNGSRLTITIKSLSYTLKTGIFWAA